MHNNAQDIINNTGKAISTTPVMASTVANPETGHLHTHKMVSRSASGGLYQCECGDTRTIDFDRDTGRKPVDVRLS